MAKGGGGSSLDIKIEKLNQQMKNETIEFVLQGYSFSDVIEYLQLNYNLSREAAKHYFKAAKDDIYKLGNFDYDQIITQHVFYYEEAIRYFNSINNFSAKVAAMNAKEKLLKIFQEDEPEVEIENNVDININIGQLNFNIDKLNEKEKDRFQEIFNKVKRLNANQ